jgi:hypothetical protein
MHPFCGAGRKVGHVGRPSPALLSRSLAAIPIAGVSAPRSVGRSSGGCPGGSSGCVTRTGGWPIGSASTTPTRPRLGPRIFWRSFGAPWGPEWLTGAIFDAIAAVYGTEGQRFESSRARCWIPGGGGISAGCRTLWVDRQRGHAVAPRVGGGGHGGTALDEPVRGWEMREPRFLARAELAVLLDEPPVNCRPLLHRFRACSPLAQGAGSAEPPTHPERRGARRRQARCSEADVGQRSRWRRGGTGNRSRTPRCRAR